MLNKKPLLVSINSVTTSFDSPFYGLAHFGKVLLTNDEVSSGTPTLLSVSNNPPEVFFEQTIPRVL